VLRKKVFDDSKYVQAENTNEWYLVENKTAELMNAQSVLLQQGNPLVFDTVDRAARVLRELLRPGEVQPMDDDD